MLVPGAVPVLPGASPELPVVVPDITNASVAAVIDPSVFGNCVNSPEGVPPNTDRAYAKSGASKSVLLLSGAGELADGFMRLRSVGMNARCTTL